MISNNCICNINVFFCKPYGGKVETTELKMKVYTALLYHAISSLLISIGRRVGKMTTVRKGTVSKPTRRERAELLLRQ